MRLALGWDQIHVVDLDANLDHALQAIHDLRVADANSLIVAFGGPSGSAIAGLEEGADLHLPAGTRIPHAVAQLRAVMRRLALRQARHHWVGKLKVDIDRMEASVDGEVVKLTPSEFKVLAALVERLGQVVPNAALAQAIYGEGGEDRPSLEGIKVTISRLRLKLEAAGLRSHAIRVARGFGYIFDQVEDAGGRGASGRS
ncbi:MAG: hypothetical protein GEU28_12090 [Dehalococcoidia bacterium]|nr:hypothetical protein [Dehalococcoidia bacterium]